MPIYQVETEDEITPETEFVTVNGISFVNNRKHIEMIQFLAGESDELSERYKKMLQGNESTTFAAVQRVADTYLTALKAEEDRMRRAYRGE